MNLKPIGIVAAAGVLLLPLAAFAATYSYVDTSGNIQTVDAPSASQAINVATDIAPGSGVVLAQAQTEEPSGPNGTYQYVDTSGTVETEAAPNPAAAIELPDDRTPTSGVIAVTASTMIPPTVTVSAVAQ